MRGHAQSRSVDAAEQAGRRRANAARLEGPAPQPPNPMTTADTHHRLSLDAIRRAADAIDPVFTRSPQWVDPGLSAALGCRLLAKLETANPLRSFKGRGASFLVHERLARDTTVRANGVMCASAGNWGQAVAYACTRADIAATVFAAETASPLKIERMRLLGADVRLAGVDFDAAKDAGRAFAAERRAVFVEDGREAEVSEGHGTIAVELVASDEGRPDVIVVPLGNGAMLAGIARLAKAHAPDIEIVGVCATGADAMYRSWRASRAVATGAADTIADGIAVRVPVPEAVSDLDGLVDDVVLVDDAYIVEAMRLALEVGGLVLEPAGAAGLAAVLADPERFADRTVACVLCGGNVTVERMRELGALSGRRRACGPASGSQKSSTQ